MKILNLLVNEQFGNGMADDMGDSRGGMPVMKMSVSDLNSLQIRTLNRVNDGVVDIETASDKELDLIMELIELGLVDDDGNLTTAGAEAVEAPNTNVNDADLRTTEVDFDSDLPNDDYSEEDEDGENYTLAGGRVNNGNDDIDFNV